MIRILCCWEIGAGFGHLFRLYPLVEEFQKNKFEVFVVSKDLPSTKSIFDSLGISTYQAPTNQAPHKKFPLSINYAQNLLRNGFWHRTSLQSRLREWLVLFDTLQPDIILAEHAPVALLAARLAGLRRAAIGTGFTIPPLISPMPTIQPWFSVPQSHLCHIEDEFITLVNPVLEEFGGNPLTTVADIFEDVAPFLCTFPELDHYSERVDISYCGPIVYSPPQIKPDWPSSGGKRVFLYMRAANPYLKSLLGHLQAMPLSVLACVPDLSGSELKSMQRPNLRITNKPLDLELVAHDCDLMIGHGGTNTGTLMLLSGVPVLVCPTGLEQSMWAFRITGQRLGDMINPFKPGPDIKRKIGSVVNSTQSGNQIHEFTRKYTHYDSQQTVHNIASRITMMVNN